MNAAEAPRKSFVFFLLKQCRKLKKPNDISTSAVSGGMIARNIYKAFREHVGWA